MEHRRYFSLATWSRERHEARLHVVDLEPVRLEEESDVLAEVAKAPGALLDLTSSGLDEFKKAS